MSMLTYPLAVGGRDRGKLWFYTRLEAPALILYKTQCSSPSRGRSMGARRILMQTIAPEDSWRPEV